MQEDLWQSPWQSRTSIKWIGIIIINENKEILTVIDRENPEKEAPERKRYEQVSIPFWRIEPLESPTNAASRELDEETGLHLDQQDFFSISNPIHSTTPSHNLNVILMTTTTPITIALKQNFQTKETQRRWRTSLDTLLKKPLTKIRPLTYEAILRYLLRHNDIPSLTQSKTYQITNGQYQDTKELQWIKQQITKLLL